MNVIFATRCKTAFLLAMLVLTHSATGATYGQAQVMPLSAFPRERIAVETHSARRHLFEAWRADSYASLLQGLMFVKDSEMQPDQAMIFVYYPPQMVSMWMKNTLLPLDMLFVDERGCVVKTFENAHPGSLARIASGSPVVLVVEFKAGTIAARGIGRGDRVVRLDAAWPTGVGPCTSGSPKAAAQ
jgi:uncharacterized membrane protein (UPF0127 family)